jgi:hypothetical protein
VTWRSPAEDCRLYLRDHQDLCSAHAWTLQVFLAEGQSRATSRWYSCRLFSREVHKYLKEVEPVTQKIVESLEQDWKQWTCHEQSPQSYICKYIIYLVPFNLIWLLSYRVVSMTVGLR